MSRKEIKKEIKKSESRVLVQVAQKTDGIELNDCQIAFLSGLLACGKTNQEVCQILKIPETRVVARYRQLYNNGELDQLITLRSAGIKQRLSGQLLGIIQTALTILADPAKLSDLPADKLAVTIGILVDKYRLLNNESTSNISIISRVQALADPRKTIDDED